MSSTKGLDRETLKPSSDLESCHCVGKEVKVLSTGGQVSEEGYGRAGTQRSLRDVTLYLGRV